MIPAHATPSGHLANARVIAHGIADGYLGRDAVTTLWFMIVDIRNAIYREGEASWVLAEAWLAQASEIVRAVEYEGRPMDDLDVGALKECLMEAACALR